MNKILEKGKLNIMIVGMRNNGKFSFINTLLIALYQKLVLIHQTLSGWENTTEVVIEIPYENSPNITIYDTPGWEEHFKPAIFIEAIKGKIDPNLTISQLKETFCV